MSNVAKKPTEVHIPARFSYMHVFEPKQMTDAAGKPSGKLKFSVSLIIDKEDAALIKTIKLGIKAAYDAGLSTKFGGKAPVGWKNPLRDGDTDRPDDPAYNGKYFINASSDTKPGMVRWDKDLKCMVGLTGPDEFNSGDYGTAVVNFYAFNTNGNKGIAAGLNHLLKRKTGEPLAGKGSAENAFKDYAFDDEEDTFNEDGGGDDDFGLDEDDLLG